MPMRENHPCTGEPPLFPLGQLIATPAALATLVVANVSPHALLARHIRGDWGDLDAHDKQENERALEGGGRLLSAYDLPGGETVWAITEADRSATTLLLPEDY